MSRLKRALLIIFSLVLVAHWTGCTRERYRRRADLDSYGILNEKTVGRPWELPECFSIAPDPRSRFAQFGDLDDPALPVPAPELYAYEVPSLGGVSRQSGESTSASSPAAMDNREQVPRPSGQGAPLGSESELDSELLPPPSSQPSRAEDDYTRGFFGDQAAYATVASRWESRPVPRASVAPPQASPAKEGPQAPFASLAEPIRLATWSRASQASLDQPNAPLPQLTPPGNFLASESEPARQAVPQPIDVDSPWTTEAKAAAAPGLPERYPPFEVEPTRPETTRLEAAPIEAVASPAGSSRRHWQQDSVSEESALSADAGDAATGEEGPRIVPIPRDVWQNLPTDCLRRMFEFETIREEYRLSFEGQDPGPALRDDSQRLTLEDIIELALINSRAYQTQKEQLYRVALNLTRERFEYELRFTQNGLGTRANYSHNRNGGTTVNGLGVPTNAGVGKALNTGGDLLARFANDVVLTFNGPNGFTADVGSDLILDLSYSVLQRDIQFESLTQSERNVVYAARDFARFRKELFVNLAADYYSLIQTYRSIEIDSQNYLSLVRAFNEANAEYRETGLRSRIEVDQVEQNALSGRSRLISRCNGLEQSLDSLKLSMGIPPETPINLDLTELEELTLRDEATVAAELVTRSRRVLETNRRANQPVRAELINGAINLVERMLNLIDIRDERAMTEGLQPELQRLLNQLEVEETRLEVAFNRQVLERELNSETPDSLRIYQRTMDLVDSILALVQQQLELLEIEGADANRLEQLGEQLDEQVASAAAVREAVDLTKIAAYLETAQELLPRVEQLLVETESVAAYQEPTDEEALQETLRIVDQLLPQSLELAETGSFGLVPVEIGVNEAMLTALVQRFDLLNERGDLADTWRQIKLAGDDLRSILNLQATQVVRTDPNFNRGFDFTWDESSTNLSLRFDTPVNRRAQRNAFRNSLINYQQALRNLMELEDFIKFDIRNDLRQLQLGREQYRISVASAALAYERVVSTQLQLQLGTEGVAARDFLEAQTAYAQSLSSVASDHLSYIRSRNTLFLDLETLYVDENGFWPDLYNEEVQPEPQFRFAPNGGPVYGELPPQLHYSRRIRRMNEVPTGIPQIYSTDSAPQGQGGRQ